MTDLMVIAEKNALSVFNDPKGLEPCLNLIRQAVSEFKPDLSTAKGRKEIASLAHKVAQTKVFLDDTGKELVAVWKDKSKKVDNSRRRVREELDALKILARKPLTDWETEQAKIAAEIVAEEKRIEHDREVAEAAAKCALQLDADHELGLLMNFVRDRDIAIKVEGDRKLEEERQIEASRLQAERDERIATEAREKSEREAAEAIECAKQAEIDKINAQKTAEAERIAAEKREAAALIKSAQDVEIAIERGKHEELVAQQEKEAKEAADLQRKEANQRHVDKLIKDSTTSLMVELLLTENDARAVVVAIRVGLIKNIKFQY